MLRGKEPETGVTLPRRNYLKEPETGVTLPRRNYLKEPETGVTLPRRNYLKEPETGVTLPRRNYLKEPETGVTLPRRNYLKEPETRVTLPRRNYLKDPETGVTLPRRNYLKDPEIGVTLPQRNYLRSWIARRVFCLVLLVVQAGVENETAVFVPCRSGHHDTQPVWKYQIYFHCNDTRNNSARGQPNHDKLCHIRRILDVVLAMCKENYIPDKEQAFFDLFYLFSIILYIFANTGRTTRLLL